MTHSVGVLLMVIIVLHTAVKLSSRIDTNSDRYAGLGAVLFWIIIFSTVALVLAVIAVLCQL